MKSYFLIVIIILSIAPLTYSQTIIFEDDFESYAAGTLPTPNWITRFSGQSAKISEAVSVSGTKSFELVSMPYWSRVEAHQLSEIPDYLVYEGWVYLNQSDKGAYIGYGKKISASEYRTYNIITFRYEGEITFDGAEARIDLQPWSAQTWYKVKVYCDFINLKGKVWIDNVLKAENINLVPRESFEDFCLGGQNWSGSGTSTVYYDDIKIYAYVPPPFEDDFESYATGTLPAPNWITRFSGLSARVSEAVSVSGTKSFELVSKPSWARVETHELLDIPDYLVYEGCVYLNQPDKGACIGYGKQISANEYFTYNTITFRNEGIISFSGAEAEIELQSWSSQTWYKVKVYCDFINLKGKVWIDDVLKAENINLVPRESVEDLCLAGRNWSGSGTSTVYYDDIKLYAYVLPPEPPVLVEPANGEFTNNNTPFLSFTVPTVAHDDSLHFKIEIATDDEFENQIAGSPYESRNNKTGFYPPPPLPQGKDSCSYTLQNPLNDGIYYWRVSAFNGYYYSDLSEVYQFGVDTTPPTGTIAKSPVISSSKLFNVNWEGGSDNNGSGLSGEYDVLVKINDSNWIYWKTKFPAKSATYEGQYDSTYYYFEALAWDNAGNREDSTGNIEAGTFVDITTKDLQAPSCPIGLMANGDNPSPWQQNNVFKITWYNPFDPSGITKCLYKLGAEPQSNYDTTGSYTSTPIPPLKIEATQEYGQLLYVWLEDGGGNLDFQSNKSVELRFDATPPEVKITYPKADIIQSGDSISVNATIFDYNKFEYLLEYKMIVTNQWKILRQDSSNESFENDRIHLWTDIRDSGNVYLRLTAEDRVGNSFSDSVKFTLDNRDYQLPTAMITQPYDSSYISGWLSIIGSATDQDFKQYFIYLKGRTIDTLLTIRKTPIEHGPLEAFYTKLVPDGQYTLFLEVVNSKEYRKLTSVTIYIDNTPPFIELTAPLSDTISCFVPIQGNIIEDNLKNKILKYAPSRETDVSNFITLDTTFTYWNTMNLNGDYSLYISAEDKAGLKSDTIRTYYIDNPIFEAQNGLLKQQGQYSLYIPPNGYASSVICFENKNIDEFGYDPAQLVPTDLIVEIHSSITEEHFTKPGVFKINYNNLNLSNYNEGKLSVFNWDWENENWNFIGGTVNNDNKTVTTTIDQIGIYGLFQNEQDTLIINRPLELTCKPRIFSPLGDGYDRKTAISFSLNQETNVTIKVYNAAGRLVKVLIENRFLPPGNHVVEWNGTDRSNKFCASGMYIVFIEAGNKTATKTCMVLNEK